MELFIVIWSLRISCLSNQTNQESKLSIMVVAVFKIKEYTPIFNLDFIELQKLF
jgi:hypothetical protein